jgi:hypothetical protein
LIFSAMVPHATWLAWGLFCHHFTLHYESGVFVPSRRVPSLSSNLTIVVEEAASLSPLPVTESTDTLIESFDPDLSAPQLLFFPDIAVLKGTHTQAPLPPTTHSRFEPFASRTLWLALLDPPPRLSAAAQFMPVRSLTSRQA